MYSSSGISFPVSMNLNPCVFVKASKVEKYRMQCKIELAGVDRASEQEQTAQVPQKSRIRIALHLSNSIAAVVHWWIVLQQLCDVMHTTRI